MKKNIVAAFLVASCFVGGAALAKDRLIVANVYDAKSLDPATSNDIASHGLCYQIYDNLLRLTDSNEMVPQLAESWETLNPTTFKFNLRKGVKFHNGEPFTSADVAYTIERAKSPIATPSHQFTDTIEKVETPNDYTVIFHLKYAYTPFLMTLGHGWAGIVNQKAVEAAGDTYSMKPVGTGPFKFVSWSKNDRVILERNDDYWGEKPVYKTLEMRSIPESTSRTIALESGDVDIAYQISPMDIKRVEDNENLRLTRVNSRSTTYMGLNCSKAPLDNPKVRQALWHALDVKTIHEAAWHGVGSVPVAPMAPSILYHANNLPTYEFSPEKAKALLAEAGVKLPLKLEVWTNELQQRQDMAQMIQAYLQAVDIHVEIKVLEWGAYLAGLEEKKQDLYLLGWSASVPDPDYALYGVFFSKGPSNYTALTDEKLDEILLKGRQMPNSDGRQAVYQAAQEYIVKTVPWIFLHNDEQISGMQKNVSGFVLSPRGYQPLAGVTFTE